MRDMESLTDLLDALRVQYTPEKPELKLGIGHDIEHVKGAVRRAGEIVEKMEEDPDMYRVHIDREIVTIVSALHDIGNTVNRSAHAEIGAGVVDGGLSVDRLLSVPVRSKDDGLFLTKEQKEEVRDILNGEMPGIETSDKLYDAAESCLETIMKFDLGYYGVDGKDPNQMDADELRQYLEEKYLTIDRKIVTPAIDALYKDGKLDDISYNPALKDITERLRELFTPEELKTIADAVQDHNIDYEDIDVRYIARNIYGSIVFDADKDEVIGTSVIRTMAFAVNKCTVMSPWFLDRDGKPDMSRCGRNVLEQEWERSTEAVEKYLERNPEYAGCVHEYGETPYVITQTYGDDVFSQIDYIFNPQAREDPLCGRILSLRLDCISAVFCTYI